MFTKNRAKSVKVEGFQYLPSEYLKIGKLPQGNKPLVQPSMFFGAKMLVFGGCRILGINPLP